MYPSKGKSGKGSLAFAFEIHDIASTREKRQEIKETHAGLASFKTLSRIWASQANSGGELHQCIYIIMGNPVDISMYFVSRSQHACKVPCPKFPTLIGFRKFSTVTLFSWHQKRNVSFRGGSSGAFAAITAIPAGNSVLSSLQL